ncbi:hypothetical protein WCLP8_5310008 [uncultured Gammaproteobacteria bacterium]
MSWITRLALVATVLIVGCAELPITALPTADACGSVVGRFEGLGEGLAKSAAVADLSTEATEALSEDRLTALLDGVRAENTKLDQIQAAYTQVTECRKAEVRKVRAAFKEGRLDRVAADRGLAELRRLYREDLLLARAIGGTMDRRGCAVHDADRTLATLAATDRRPAIRRLVRTTVEARRRIAEQTASNIIKRNDYIASIVQAEDWRDKGFALS